MKNKKRPAARSDAADAFVAEPERNDGPVADDLAEYLGESYLSSATGGEDSDQALHDDLNIDELGGPFIETDAGVEVAPPEDGEAVEAVETEAFPTAIRADRASPIVRHRR